MKIESIPERNKFGLIIPPSPEELEYLSLFKKPSKRPDFVDRHHLYWPKVNYTTSLAKEFRRHRFNSVWMLLSDHKQIHAEYDGVPVPSRDVMLTFLDEAGILDDMGVCVQAIEMINDAIYEGRVSKPELVEESRQQRVETLILHARRVNDFEVMPSNVVQHVVQELGELPLAA